SSVGRRPSEPGRAARGLPALPPHRGALVSPLHLLLALGLVALAVHAGARDYRFSDAHVHYVDFFQESDGMDALFAAMDEAGVEHVMLAGIPVAKKWHENEPKLPRYYAGDEAGAYRFRAIEVVVLCGGTSPPTQ